MKPMMHRWLKFLGLLVLMTASAFVLYRIGHNPAPTVTFVSLEGEKLSTAQLRGHVTLVNFWATDCPICMAEMPELIETYTRYRQRGLEFIAVAMQYNPPNYVVAFNDRNRLPFKVALDPMGDIARRFGNVSATPTLFVIDKRGDIVERMVGAPDFRKLRALLEEKLAES
jgi:peroxiredoxin